jgi:hypothetical protein
LAVLDRPPLPLPRAPLDVTAHIVERGDGDERECGASVWPQRPQRTAKAFDR